MMILLISISNEQQGGTYMAWDIIYKNLNFDKLNT